MSTSSIARNQSELGARLRQLREINGLSLRELARRAGCSASLISQVERGITTPSAGIVYTLANELGVSLDSLFGTHDDHYLAAPAPTPNTTMGTAPAVDRIDVERGTRSHSYPTAAEFSGRTAPQPWGRATGDDGTGIVQRADDRSVIQLSTGVRWERLTPDHDRRVDFLEVVYEPLGKSSDGNQAVRHDGREYLLVLEGEIDAVVGFDTIRLRVGDSLAFDPHTPHQYSNPTGALARCLSVVVHEDPTD